MAKQIKSFFKKVNLVVSQIHKGSFLTYKLVAQKTGSPGSYRAVGNILSLNKDKKVFCHRVIKSDHSVGGFRKDKKDSFLKAGLLLKEGVIGVVPTDTIYGILGLALDKSAVEKIYRLRKRSLEKPMIILISCLDDLKKFKIKISRTEQKILQRVWPGKVSVILNCSSKSFFYLHRGKNTLAFRMPKSKYLLETLRTSGPLVAPSANWEGHNPATTISQARKYFGNQVFYLNRGKITSKPSSLIKIVNNKIVVLRQGARIKNEKRNF